MVVFYCKCLAVKNTMTAVPVPLHQGALSTQSKKKKVKMSVFHENSLTCGALKGSKGHSGACGPHFENHCLIVRGKIE